MDSTTENRSGGAPEVAEVAVIAASLVIMRDDESGSIARTAQRFPLYRGYWIYIK